MSLSGLESIDSTIHTTNIWLNEIAQELGWDDRSRAYTALRATLQTLRDRLTVEEATDLGAQLPMLVRGFYYEGWNPSGKPLKERKKEEFLEHIRVAFRNDPEVDAEQVARAIFRVIEKHVTSGEISDVKNNLPENIRSLWT